MSENKVSLRTDFGGVKSEQQNALLTALVECGKDHFRDNNRKKKDKQPPDNALYEWLKERPKTILTAELVDKLNELGYKIVKE
jgi:hypothetical protein